MAEGAIFNEGPFLRVIEVGWGGRVGILTATITGANSYNLKRNLPTTPTAPIAVYGGEDPGIHDDGAPDYAIGEEIKKDRWKKDYIEHLSLPGNPSNLLYDRWGAADVYALAGHDFVVPAADIASEIDGGRFYDTYVYGSTPIYRRDFWSGDYIYTTTFFNQSYRSFAEDIDAHPLDGLAAINQHAAEIGATIVRASTPSFFGLINPGGSYVQPVINLDGSLNHYYTDEAKYAHNHFNPYIDPVRVDWLIYKLGPGDNPYPGLRDGKIVWLINLGKIGHDGEIGVNQLVSDVSGHFTTPPIKTGFSFTCQFELKIYSSGKLFAGAERTVTHSGGGSLVYNVTKTLDWEAVGENLLRINRNGFVEPPP